MKLGIVGSSGRWGQNIVKTLLTMPEQHELLFVEHNKPIPIPGAPKFSTLHDLIATGRPDAIIIATPEEMHAKQLYRTLLARIPVFIEKPMCTSLEDAHVLSKAWEKTGHGLMLVNHVQLFNPGFRALLPLVEEGVGAASVHVQLHNEGPRRFSCSPLWDYGSHAIAMSLLLAGFPWNKGRTHVCSADGVSMQHGDGTVSENVAAHLMLAGICNAHLLVGNNIPLKANRTIVTTHNGFIYSYDDVTGKLRLDNLMSGDVPTFDLTPPLHIALETFLRAVEGLHDWQTDVRFGMQLPLEVVRVLDLIDECLEDMGEDRPQRLMRATAV